MRGWGKYCSKDCQNKGQFKGDYLDCLICGKEVYRSQAQIRHSKSKRFFCSKSCQTTWRNSFFSEEKHPNWLNGINAYRKILLRAGGELVCIGCGINDLRVLAVHHIDHNRENNDRSNLTWVCHNCHFLIHHDNEFEKNLKQIIIRE